MEFKVFQLSQGLVLYWDLHLYYGGNPSRKYLYFVLMPFQFGKN